MTTSLTLAPDLTLTRMGYGAMQLAGPGVMGPPKDRDEAIAVLRAVVDAGITHIDTSDAYGPHITNSLIREALHPYAEGLHIVTKVGALRSDDGAWVQADSREDLRAQVHDNLNRLGLDVLDVVNLRNMQAKDSSVAERIGVLAELQQEGLIRHLGVSEVSRDQLDEARKEAPIVCVQNLYNLANRADDDLVDTCAAAGIAFVPYFPLGGFSPLQATALSTVATRLGASEQQVALAWLLHRSPTTLVIPGTSSRTHLTENLAAATLALPTEARTELDRIGAAG
ncbi:oxidoreductase [Kribbella sandramycini]|uniref:Oxidoreductase n=1 Tax=Kribbella sandramycini TaxID=60450 RepID=A0A7Y4L048_9ACTN|nr:oxidoreductase [Kribbella sandramycini]MBB6569029.1 aryl-alcohol dehydrogenase-like predicted oxidoreductase [Kribbella sandramycini]NOL41127.1 oxidoreductase [Kribbella sandramycini]